MKTRVICHICGKHIRWIVDIPVPGFAYGLCRDCNKAAMQKLDHALRQDEALRQQKEPA